MLESMIQKQFVYLLDLCHLAKSATTGRDGKQAQDGSGITAAHTITYTVTHVDLDQINPTTGISFQHGPKVKKEQRTAHNSAHKQKEK